MKKVLAAFLVLLPGVAVVFGQGGVGGTGLYLYTAIYTQSYNKVGGSSGMMIEVVRYHIGISSVTKLWER